MVAKMKLRFLTSGESHGPALVTILEGIPAGLSISVGDVNQELSRRQKGYGAGPRMKIESDSVEILAGVMEGKTTGAPLAMIIRNRDHKKWHGKRVAPFTVPRPGHADLTGAVKYGYNDLRPSLERASARETAARVAIGAICKQLLNLFNISVCGYVISIGEVSANLDEIPLEDRFLIAEENDVRCPDTAAAKKMNERILKVMNDRDTLGGVIEVAALGIPPGLGSHVHWDRRLDARLGAAVLSVQAIKGMEIGPAFENTRKPGTESQDPIRLDGEKIIRTTNRAGGIEGGISNGNPLIIRAAMKPIATTLKPQQTVDLSSGMEVPSQYERSDFCPVPRAVPIIEAMVAYVIADALLEKLGGDSVEEIQGRFTKLKRTQLSDLRIDSVEHIFWPSED
jgi:chorismate synthase